MMDSSGPGVGDVASGGDDADQPLLDLLDALVNDRGPTAAAEALGVNYRTVSRCQQSRRVSRRMREVLVEFRDSQDVGDDGADAGGGDDAAAAEQDRAAALERENRELRETVETQAEELDVLRRRVAELEDRAQPPAEPVSVEGREGQAGEWHPPARGHGLPDAGVVTLEKQPDEAHVLGPAAPLVAEWRKLRTGVDQAGSRVDRAVAAVRRWEVETEMLRDFQLTLPPETEPLDASRRQEQLRWRDDALADARRELGRAKRTRLLRRVVTLGLWRR